MYIIMLKVTTTIMEKNLVSWGFEGRMSDNWFTSLGLSTGFEMLKTISYYYACCLLQLKNVFRY